MAKIFKFIWLVSVLGGLAALLWVYASVPLTVKVAGDAILGKEAFFYLSLAFLTITNTILYLVGKNDYVGNFEMLKIWKFTFGVVINAFIIVSMLFINVYNSTEAYNFSNSGYLILIFLSLMVAWLIALPFIILFGKKTS